MAAYKTNESVASFLVKNLKKKYPLSELNVGILGMAFKGNSDDRRSSLAYKLKRHLKMECKQVITSDPYIKDDFTLTSLKDLLDHSDLIIIGAPHSEFRDIDFKTSQIVIDIWAFLESSH
jgi:UDP-N-acetyl-D-mannosaminuronic acid dehydrogenase